MKKFWWNFCGPPGTRAPHEKGRLAVRRLPLPGMGWTPSGILEHYRPPIARLKEGQSALATLESARSGKSLKCGASCGEPGITEGLGGESAVTFVLEVVMIIFCTSTSYEHYMGVVPLRGSSVLRQRWSYPFLVHAAGPQSALPPGVPLEKGVPCWRVGVGTSIFSKRFGRFHGRECPESFHRPECEAF
jgi:hypothetical protein